jgi:hypothetical protein
MTEYEKRKRLVEELRGALRLPDQRTHTDIRNTVSAWARGMAFLEAG